MSRAALCLLAAGVLLFLVLLLSHDLPNTLAILALARWGILLVALFHLLPLICDAGAIRVLEVEHRRGAWISALTARWIGESANSLLPAGQLGGLVLMVRQLMGRGTSGPQAVAAITASTTLQSFAQVVFALLGLALLTGRISQWPTAWWAVALPTAVCIGLLPATFYLLQRRGLFLRLWRLASRLAPARDWSHLERHAARIDGALAESWRRRTRVGWSFVLSLAGWLAGTGEVWLLLRLLHSPVSWSDALLLESLGQAIRGASFAIPASLGVQEGGYLLLAPLAGLHPDVALALSLGKRARELLLGVPGLIYLHHSERSFRRRPPLLRPGEPR
jgi:putative membrane protein